MKLNHLIDFNDMSAADWDALYNLACDIKKSPEKYSDACKGKIMATLFYEPSTRTQLSFQAAMFKLGGNVIGFADPNSSSVAKGESFRDTVKIVSNYADIMVIRNPFEGAAYAASLYSTIPIINAGDGGHLHPTQTMADMFTIYDEKQRYENLHIGLCGDLYNGRTVHSLIKAFSRYSHNHFYLISTNELKLPCYIYNILKESGNEIFEIGTIDECIDKLDILYMTRIQKERFISEDEYIKQSGIYILNEEKLSKVKSDIIIMHPLPKIDEISTDIDDDPRAIYFKQAANGLYVRMALILTLYGSNKEKFKNIPKYKMPAEKFCNNKNCITNHEHYLPSLTIENNGQLKCAYCENIL